MVGLIVDLKPLRIKKRKKELQKEIDAMSIKLKTKIKPIRDPVRSKFQID